jgi:hypothetical protein
MRGIWARDFVLRLVEGHVPDRTRCCARTGDKLEAARFAARRWSFVSVQTIPAMTLAYQPPRELRNIRPIGRCIYCGRTDNLAKEHAIPSGMGGTITLPKGSCPTCAKLTQEIETTCMRKTLLHVRVKSGLHRHRNERPSTLPVIFSDWSDNKTTRKVTVADFPMLWAMPIYEYPGILLNRKPAETGFGMLYAHKEEASFKKLLSLPGVKSITVTPGAVTPLRRQYVADNQKLS